MFPEALVMLGGVATASGWREFAGVVAAVFEDPGVDASDIEIYRTRTQQLVIEGSGFTHRVSGISFTERKTVRTILEFDPPIDSANFNLNVRHRVIMCLCISSAKVLLQQRIRSVIFNDCCGCTTRTRSMLFPAGTKRILRSMYVGVLVRGA